MNQKFIQTQDAPTVTLLSQLGYQQVQNSNGIYVFLNTDTLRFSENIDINKLKYTNMLTFQSSSLGDFYYVRKEEKTKQMPKVIKKKILTEEAIAEGKPANIAEKMVMGRINKFYKEICLEEQEFVKDNSVSVSKYVSNNGGNIIDVIRYEVGEGLEKRQENFAEEVAAQMNGE